MKKLFALFCAIVLMPAFSAQAWIGGPFSNNSFFGEDGDDGVYEAVAFPTVDPANPAVPVLNGIGIFRWAVTNTKAFADDVTTSVTQTFFDDQGNIVFTIVDVQPLTSNVYFGGVGQVGHSWFIEGVAYRGNCDGIVNSGLNVISAVGLATNPAVATQRISSGFTAVKDGSGQGIIVSRFSGTGNGRVIDGAITTNFRFLVFGSRVTTTVTYNAVSG